MSIKSIINIKYTITDERLAHLLCSALESNVSSWMKILRVEEPLPSRKTKPWGDDYTPNYIYAPFSDTGYLVIRDIEDNKSYVVARIQLQQALVKMAESYPKHFSDFLTENDDAITADVFLQCAVLGEVIYG